MKSQQYTYAFNYIPRLHKLDEHLCFLFPVLFFRACPTCPVFSGFGPNRGRNILKVSSVGAEQSRRHPHHSPLRLTDMAETLPSCQVWGPVLNLAPRPPKLFVSHSFSLALLHACFPLHISPSYCCFPSLPLIFCFTKPPPRPFWTLMSRPLRQCGLCLRAVRAGTLPTGTLNGTN